jgi:hypothetical protein
MICAWDWCALNTDGTLGQFNRYWHDLSEDEKEVSTIAVLTQINAHKCIHRHTGIRTLSPRYPER